MHLWEIDHPYYGTDAGQYDVANFAALCAEIDNSDDDMNRIYRWDWEDDSQPHRADLFLPHENRSGQRFVVYLLMPRKSGFWSVRCPIAHDQEVEVLEWLRGPRVLGSLRTLWAPLLDDPA